MNFLSFLQNLSPIAEIRFLTTAFSFQNALDILLTALVIGMFLRLFKKTQITPLFISGVVGIVAIYLIAKWFNLYTILSIVNALLSGIVIILFIIFQKEFRRFIEWINVSSIRKRFRQKKENDFDVKSEVIKIIASVAFNMAKRKMGGIIVLPGNESIDSFVSGGFDLDGRVSEPLLLSIFDTSTPGHDGAVIIDRDVVKKFGVVLPLSERDDYEKIKHLGTRHRSALGLSERTDALCIVISEEKKKVSIAFGGKIETIENKEDLEKKLNSFLNVNQTVISSSKIKFAKFVNTIRNNYKESILALIIAFVFWAMISFPHSGIVQKEFIAPVVFKNLPSNASIEKLNVPEVRVILSGLEKDFQFIDAKDVKVSIDLFNYSIDNQTKHISVNLNSQNIQFPKNLRFIRAIPSQLEFKLVFNQ